MQRRSPTETPIDAGDVHADAPLSFAQQRLWFLSRLSGPGPAYHIALALHLQGRLEVSALSAALQRIVRRHAALRTGFVLDGEQPVQRVSPADGGFLLAHSPAPTAGLDGAALARLRQEEIERPFDLAQGPLLRARLVAAGDDEHLLLLTLHHIAADGWSVGVLMHELGVQYAACRDGQADPLPPLPIQYIDYARWQRRTMSGEALRAQSDYWQRTLHGAPVLLPLPTDRPRPAEQSHAGASVPVVLEAGLVERLKALGLRHGCTLFMTLLAGWALVLERLSGQQDLVIGTPVANRGRAELEPLIGFFVNTLAMRLDLSGTPTVAELLQRVRGRAMEAQQHQDLPFEQVVELLQPPRSLSHSPLFQVAFAWQNNETGTLSLPGLTLTPLPASHEVAKFDLTLELTEDQGRIVGRLEYATALFDRATVERYAGHLQQALAAMVEDEQQPVDRLHVMPPAELALVLQRWNQTALWVPEDLCLHELVEVQAARQPAAVAVVHGERHLSYGELNEQANRLAHELRRLGVKPDERVGLCCERGLELAVGLLAVLKAGGAYVPLDPAYPKERLQYMLQDSAPVVVLVQGVGRERIDAQVPVLDLQDAAGWVHQPSSNPSRQAVGLQPSHLAYVIYTSGSTGQPKGVAIEHRNAVNFLSWAAEAFDAEQLKHTLWATSVNFDLAVYEYFAPLSVGTTVEVVGNALEAAQATGEVTLINTVPSALQALLESDQVPASVKTVNLAGEALKRSLVEALFERTGVEQVCNLYGPSETTTYSTWVEMKREDGFVSHIGRPIANTQIYLLDSQGRPVPVGVPGEIHIGGAGVARGYLNRPELTAERFLKDPFASDPQARMYKTGDLGRWLADGQLEYLGRNDHQVKIRGFRIELGEIEARLAQHAGVREAVVLAREDQPGDKRLVAYVTAQPGAALEAEALRGELLQQLPEYMVPVAYVVLEQLPLTPNGKLDRQALPAPEGEAYAARQYEAPQGEVESRLAGLWAELLKVERVGRHDNFFELGGHSLLAVTLIERMRQAGLPLDVRALFATPTLGALAASIGGAPAAVEVPPNLIPPGCRAIEPEMLTLVALSREEIEQVEAGVPGGAANIQDIYPLAPLQEGILFHHLMAESGDVYVTPALFAFDSRERLQGYLQALQAVIDRHDILRTSLCWEGLGEPVQVVWRQAPLVVQELQLDAAQGGAAGQLQARLAGGQLVLPLQQAPLMRVAVAEDRAQGRWLALQLFHHVAIDHTTLEILLQEIQAHLQGQAQGLPRPLPFRDFVAQARLAVSRQEHQAFFSEMLGAVEEATLPYGLGDVQGQGRAIVQSRRQVPGRLAQRLRANARVLGVSVASLCHLAYGQVLARVCQREEVVFGTVLFGRMQGGAGADRALGLFLNTLPLKLQVGEVGVQEAVRQTQRWLARLLRHEHAPLALAQRCSRVPASLPLFSALLNYRHASPQSKDAGQAIPGIELLDAQERTNYPFNLCVDDLGQGLSLTAQVQAPADPERLCTSMLAALEALATALERAPQTPLRELDVLPAEDRQALLVDWNRTASPYPHDRCVHQLIESQVARTPEAVALVQGDQVLSYAQMNAEANRLARRLRQLGVVPDARVGLCLPRGPRMAVAVLAVLKAGGAYVPLDASYPAQRLQHMLQDSAPVVVLWEASVGEAVAQVLKQAAPLLDLEADRSQWQDEPADNLPRASVGLQPQHLAYVVYTSGSTGMPKGVAVEHRGVCNLAQAQVAGFGIEAGSRVLQFASFSFDAWVSEWVTALSCGASLHFAPPGTVLAGEALLQALQQGRISHVTLPPAVLAALPATATLAPVSTLVLAGEAASPALVQRWGEGRRVINAYGPSETTVCATMHRCEGPLGQAVPIGRPIANTRIYLLDAQGRPVPVGVAGEIHIGGVQLARGYLNRPELTAERFVKDPFVDDPQARMYKTGDLGRWLADGTLEFLGRNDHQVKLRGFRIELGEIEARLLQHGAVREAVVLAREDQPGDKRLVAYVTLSSEASAEVLKQHLAAQLPEYMVPAAYVVLPELPLTPNGKLDRAALPQPEGAAYISRGYEAPIGEVETTLAQLWAELLKVERVGRHDNFFELGGHSLLAVSLIERLRQAGLPLDVRSLFATPTLAALALSIGGGMAAVEVPPNRIPPGCTAIEPEMLSLVQLSRDEIAQVVASVPGGAANIQDIYPLAPLQEGILFHHLMAQVGDVYLTPALLAFDSRARLDAYLQALQAVVDRHDILRTSLCWEGLPAPVQVVWRQAPLAVQELTLDPAEGDLATQLRERHDPAHYRIDLRRAPLMQLVVAHDAPHGRWLLLWLNHHLCGDHTTQEVMLQEIQAHLLGRAGRLPVALPFRNFVAQSRSGVDAAGHEAFFRELLAGVDEPTYPFGLGNAQDGGRRATTASLALDAALGQRLRELSRALRVNVASLCHLAFALLLARACGRDDVVFGTLLFGRMQAGAGADRVLGLFVNTLPIRLRVDGGRLDDSVRHTHRLLARLLRHEHAPLALAQRCSSVAPPLPLFSALFNYRHFSAVPGGEPLAADAWSGIEFLGGEERTNYPLSLSVDDHGEGFGLTAQVDSGVSAARVCEYMETALRSLVQALETAPETPLWQLEVMPQAERQQVLQGWNASARAQPPERCIHELIEAQARATPEAVAVEQGGARLSYAQLNAEANRLARYLRQRGVQPDSRVAVCLPRGPQLVVAWLAVWKAGGAYVPLDAAYPRERLAYLVQDSAPVLVLTDAERRTALEGGAAAVVDLQQAAPEWAGEPAQELAPDGLQARHLAYVIYTSGSTGQPKGVMVEHRQLGQLVAWHNEAFGVEAGQRTSSVAGLGFDAAAWEVWPALCAGATLVLAPQAVAQDVAGLLRWWQAETLAVSFLPTPIAELALAGGQVPQGLRVLLVGGDRLRQRAPAGAGYTLVNNYGPTEATVVATSGPVGAQGVLAPAVGAPTEAGAPTQAGVITIGWPIGHTRIYLLDEQGRPVPIGVAGELYIGGPSVARGYLGRQALTAERFVRDPFAEDAQARMYKTGDLARWLADGQLEFLGRNDQQLKIRGLRIEPGEIEAQLALHPEVREAVVLAREERLVAYVTPAGGQAPQAEALRRHLAQQLPEYMVPAAYVVLPQLPLTPNGKLDRDALPAPDADAHAARPYEAPVGEVEATLAQLWCELLQVERVGRHDHFFELGGHSLLAVRLVTRLRQLLQVELALGELFAQPTLLALAERVAAAARSELAPIEPVAQDEPLPLSFAQQRLWFLAQMRGVSEAYHLPLALRLSGPLDRKALRQALDRIQARHAALRTRFVRVGDTAVQRIDAAEAGFALQEHDLRGQDPEQVLPGWVAREVHAPFDLEQGPLARGQLLVLGEQDHVLLLTLHHIVADGWSVGVLLRELDTLYRAALAGTAGDPLEPLPLQYADYAAWQRQWLSGEVLQAQTDYWQRALLGAPVLLELPTDRPRPAQQDHAGASVPLYIDAATTAALKALARRQGSTLFMTLLAGFGLLLARLSGQDDVVIGSPVANRRRPELEPLIGFFANTLALRLQLAGAPSVAELLQRARRCAIEAQQHQELPFEQVVDIVKPPRSLAHGPLCQVAFAWQNNELGELRLGELSLAPVPGSYEPAKFDLTLELAEHGDAIAGRLQYATALFDADTAGRWAGYLVRLLAAMAADESQPAHRLPLLDRAERQQLLHDWNATEVDYPRDRCLHELIEACVARQPEAVAVVHEGRTLSYAELNARANRLAHQLRSHGVAPDSRVGVCMERSLEMVVALLATLKAGGAYVPLDPSHPEARLVEMCQDSLPVVLLTHGRVPARLQSALRSALACHSGAAVIDVEADAPRWALRPATNLDPRAIGLGPRHLAYVIYTSGSTGVPKGVMNEHLGIVNRLLWMQDAYRLGGQDAVLQKTPFGFDVSVWEFFWPLLAGARLVMARADGHKDPAYLVDVIEREGITTLHFVPSMLQLFIDQADTARCTGLSRILCSGEALPGSLARRTRHGLPQAALHNLYGPTEAAVDVTAWACDSEPLPDNIPIGRPIANTRIYLLDAQGEPVPRGVAGELHIGGVQVARGYLNRRSLTAERFVHDPHAGRPDARMYKTGDLARHRSDGAIEFLGRNDHQVKLRGLRIELGEIEARLARHAGVQDVRVVARAWGGQDPRLVAYLVPSAGRAAAVRELLRLRQAGVDIDARCTDLPNGMTVFQQNQGETDFVYQEIFQDQVYLRHGVQLHDGDCVFDVGANIGLFSLFAARHRRGVQVYAFEPIPPVCETLRLNARLHGIQAQVFECGLAAEAGQARFTFYPHNTILSSSLTTAEQAREVVRSFLRNDGQARGLDDGLVDELVDARLQGRAYDCRLSTLSTVIREQAVERIDLLKIDVENAEYEVLLGLQPADWRKVRQVVMEVHDVDSRLYKVVRLLRGQGFEVHSEQDRALQGSALHSVYAVRPQPVADRAPEAARPPAEAGWHSPAALQAELKSVLRSQLPEYMVPTAFVLLDALPLTANGKLDHHALPLPEAASAAGRPHQAPQGETEALLARIWAEVLGLERVGRQDNFFELGGHSLLAVSVVERLRQAGLQADVQALFLHTDLAGLAQAVQPQARPVDVPPNGVPAGCRALAPEMLPLVSLTAGELDRIVAGVPGGAANVQDIYPLAPLQEGILFHHRTDAGGDPYLTPVLLGFDSRGRLLAYLEALQAVIDRHDILRTALHWDGLAEPVQVVWRHAPLAVEEVRLDASDDDTGQQLLQRFDRRHYRFDVRQAPLMRAFVAREAGTGRWLLLQLLHHLAIDHTTLELMLQEVQACLHGQAAQLPPPLPFRDFVAQARLAVPREEHEAFFGEMLGKVDTPTLPYGLREVRGGGAPVAEARREMDAALARRLRERARALGVSVASLCHLAYGQVLARLCQQEEVVFGTVLFGRMQGGAGADRALGLFLNTLPLKLRVAGQGVQDAVRETQQLLARLLRHEHAPLALAQRCSRVAAPAPLFSALLNYRHSGAAASRPGLAGVQVLAAEERTNYPFGLCIDDLGDGFLLTAQVQAPAEAGRVCAGMLAALEALASALERAPQTPLRELDVLPAEERQALLVDWNRTASPYPHDRCVHQLIESQVARTPDAVALVQGDQRLSYAQMNAEANRLARRLRQLGVVPDARVGLCLPRGPQMAVAVLAVLKAGGAYVPLDASYPAQRLQHMLQDSAPVVVLWEAGVGEAVAQVLKRAAPLLDVEADRPLWQDEPADDLACATQPQHLAYVVYTSGSTGVPKGVAVEHRGVCNLAQAQVAGFGIEAGSRVLQFASFSFDAWVSEWVTALSCGASLHFAPPGTVLAGEALLQALQQGRISHVTLPPAVLAGLPATATLAPVSTLVLAGEAASPALVQRWGEGRRVINAYGPSETTVCATMHRCEGPLQHSVPIGRPIANTRIYLLDAQGRVVPVGVAGEIHIGGAQLARGYLNRPELTAERFVKDPFVDDPQARMYKTGDLGRWLADGTLEFLGRNDHQVKLRGFRIELGEIEARLLQHGAVREAVVLAREDQPGDKRLVAYVTLSSEASAEVLKQHLAAQLPEYMVPAAYVVLPELPLTPNGKLDRAALPQPEGAAYISRGYEAPIGEVETRLAQLWAELLKVERVGRHDNFFELGGHSLLAVGLIERLRGEGLHLDVRALFDAPTLSSLVAATKKVKEIAL
ncbi:non-ribosomal peptide synthetase [Eleftheria terrae]|uniref:non-ribosomal peptide synthetase n=1 Tax=Eleftheria terrae TaxID=1597781 RepID=UPI00263ADBFD|nr:non-ribosomal peptide synthetase [Eleftheria terrae]WKB55699.1 amino acid adenylation domain-containing protein [Eleftheria terrae]